jgi:heme exporter protein B
MFFAMVVVLFPLGLGPAPATLAQFAPGILWIVALLATLLGSEGLFRSDFDDGSLDQLLLAPQPAVLRGPGLSAGALAAHGCAAGSCCRRCSP